MKSKRLTTGELGHLQKASLAPLRYLREFRVDAGEAPKLGDRVGVDIFKTGEKVDVVGTSKGKGFQGGVKRHGFAGGPKTHGASDRQRAPGSIGSTTTPGRVYKGKRMAGHMGTGRVTSSGLKVALVDVGTQPIGIGRQRAGPQRRNRRHPRGAQTISADLRRGRICRREANSDGS